MAKGLKNNNAYSVCVCVFVHVCVCVCFLCVRIMLGPGDSEMTQAELCLLGA